MNSHDFEICRSIYTHMRKTHKAPAVTIFKLSSDHYAGETTDGKIINENLQGYCCKWAAKVEMLNEWIEENEKEL